MVAPQPARAGAWWGVVRWPMSFRISIASTPEARAACVALRIEVFVDEQRIPRELELDGHEEVATHFLAVDEPSGAPAGTARLVATDGRGKIGRVAVVKARRRAGVGAALVRAAMEEARRADLGDAWLSAQVSAIAFYERLGFAREGAEYLEDGILHARMRARL
jgi:predicted GNAT family N-acyltransferase